MRAKLIGYLDTLNQVREKYPSSDKSDAAIYARAIANMRQGNLDGARVGTGTLIARHPKNPYFYELLGDIEYQFGHYDNSVEAYEKSLALAKGDLVYQSGHKGLSYKQIKYLNSFTSTYHKKKKQAIQRAQSNYVNARY